jgi:hypothetical protein
MVPPPVNADGSTADPLGVSAQGNRVLLIGDSILASTASRYGGQMCQALVPLGWQVAVEAEPSRFVDFGNRVLDRVLESDLPPQQDWNVAAVFLGSNYGGDETAYEAELRRMLDRLAPRPTLLFTVTEYRPDYAEVNEVVERLWTEYDNVTLLDWRRISQTPGVLSGDRLHPTTAGREVLAQAVAASLGPIGIGTGACLDPVFRDDSGIGGGGRGSNIADGSPDRPSAPATTAAPRPQPATTTTVAGGDGAGTGSGGSGSDGTGGGGTASTIAPSDPPPPPPEPVTSTD